MSLRQTLQPDQPSTAETSILLCEHIRGVVFFLKQGGYPYPPFRLRAQFFSESGGSPYFRKWGTPPDSDIFIAKNMKIVKIFACGA